MIFLIIDDNGAVLIDLPKQPQLLYPFKKKKRFTIIKDVIIPAIERNTTLFLM